VSERRSVRDGEHSWLAVQPVEEVGLSLQLFHRIVVKIEVASKKVFGLDAGKPEDLADLKLRQFSLTRMSVLGHVVGQFDSDLHAQGNRAVTTLRATALCRKKGPPSSVGRVAHSLTVGCGLLRMFAEQKRISADSGARDCESPQTSAFGTAPLAREERQSLRYACVRSEAARNP
jgi:hypothetical protein